MSREVKADRFNTSGLTVERVTLSVNRIGDDIFLYVQGEKRCQHFVIKADNWDWLTGLTDTPPIDTRKAPRS